MVVACHRMSERRNKPLHSGYVSRANCVLTGVRPQGHVLHQTCFLMETFAPHALQVCVLADRADLRDALRHALADGVTLHALHDAVVAAGSEEPSSAFPCDPDQYSALLFEWDLLQAPLIGLMCHRFRAQTAPLIALCEGALDDHIAALAVGADAVHALPLSVPLLKAQIVAHRRVCAGRGIGHADGDSSEDVGMAGPAPLRCGPLVLDRKAYAFYVQGEEVRLTRRQFAVLECFMAHPDTLLARDRILDEAWGIDFDPGTNMVDVYVHYLRQVLGDRGLEGIIRTVRGKGYRLVPPQETSVEATASSA